MVTVGAIDKNGSLHSYSSRGPELDLASPSGGTEADAPAHAKLQLRVEYLKGILPFVYSDWKPLDIAH